MDGTGPAKAGHYICHGRLKPDTTSGGPQRSNELGQLGIVQVGYCPERHVAVDPLMNVESSHRSVERPCERVIALWRDEHVDRVLLSLIDERSNRLAVDVIEPASDQRKSDRREIDDGR